MAEILKTFAIALDTKAAQYKIPTVLIEGDTGNRFVITLTDDGVAVDLSTAHVEAVFSGAMGTATQDSYTGTGQVTISGASHNLITVDVKTGSYAAGLNTCEIRVLSGATYTTLITSASFTFNAKKPIINDSTVVATNEYSQLVYWAGKYAEMLDREQADWTETDTEVGSFIQHKPVVGTDIQAATQTLTAETTLSDTDTVPFYDASATAHRKSTWANIVSTIRTLFFGTSSGLLKANGSGVISAAVSNTDYAAAAHASRHASGAADEVTPAAIGAATTSHKSTHAYGGSDVLAATDIGQYGVAALNSSSVVTETQSKLVVDSSKTSSFTVAVSDAEHLIFFNNTGAGVVTLPSDATANVPIGAAITIVQWNTGSVTFQAGSGATVNAANSVLAVSGRYSSGVAIKQASNTWWLTCS